MRNFLNILSVVVLFAGVVAGVVLVQNEQDIRKSAAPEDKVKICHKTGNGDEFNQIEIAEQAVQAHLDHGDKLTGCDQPSQASSEGGNQNNQPSQTETPAQTQSPQATQEPVAQNNTNSQNENTQNNNQEQDNSSSNQNTGGNSAADNEETQNEDNSTIYNESDTGGNTTNNIVNTNTFISPLNKNTFTFQLRLQGINKSGVTRNVTLTFTKSGKQSIRNLTAVSDSTGLFKGTISGLETGNYEVLVKPDTYLANRFQSVNVTSGTTDWNWSASNFRVGDFNNDNVINLLDIGMILAIYNQKNVAVNSSNKQYDTDASGIINEEDIDLVLGNYSSLNVSGEK